MVFIDLIKTFDNLSKHVMGSNVKTRTFSMPIVNVRKAVSFCNDMKWFVSIANAQT